MLGLEPLTAALTALALFAAYSSEVDRLMVEKGAAAGSFTLELTDPLVVIGLLIGFCCWKKSSAKSPRQGGGHLDSI